MKKKNGDRLRSYNSFYLSSHTNIWSNSGSIPDDYALSQEGYDTRQFYKTSKMIYLSITKKKYVLTKMTKLLPKRRYLSKFAKQPSILGYVPENQTTQIDNR